MSPELQACQELAHFYLPDSPESADLAVSIMRHVNRWLQEREEDAEAERSAAMDRAWGI